MFANGLVFNQNLGLRFYTLIVYAHIYAKLLNSI